MTVSHDDEAVFGLVLSYKMRLCESMAAFLPEQGRMQELSLNNS